MRIDYAIEHPVALHAAFDVEGFTVLLGASGEGKSMLLRAIAGLIPGQRRTVRWACPHKIALWVIYRKVMRCFHI